MKTEKQNSEKYIYRLPEKNDAGSIYSLVQSSPPLDLNSLYCYMLICLHYSKTSVVCEYNNAVVGCITGYRVPDKDDNLFIWQVAVDKSHRKMGIAASMIKNILQRDELTGIDYIQTTVNPSNSASDRFFTSLADNLQTSLKKSLLFSAEMFGAGNHEDEILYEIGPFSSNAIRNL